MVHTHTTGTVLYHAVQYSTLLLVYVLHLHNLHLSSDLSDLDRRNGRTCTTILQRISVCTAFADLHATADWGRTGGGLGFTPPSKGGNDYDGRCAAHFGKKAGEDVSGFGGVHVLHPSLSFVNSIIFISTACTVCLVMSEASMHPVSLTNHSVSPDGTVRITLTQ